MKKDFIYSHIRHISLRLFSLSLILLALVIVICINTPFDDVFNPENLTYANSASEMYDSGNEYVEITLKNINYTGYDCIRHGKIYGSYYYSLINNSCTFILVDTSSMSSIPATIDDYIITARLVPADSLLDSVLNSFATDIGWTFDGLKNITSTVVIDETEYNMVFYFYLAITYGFFLLVIISFIIANIIYFIFPWLYPTCINFRRICEKQNGIDHVNHELSNHIILHSGNISLTEHYLVAFTSFNLEIVPIDKIIWAYEHSKWHKILWIKSKLTYALYVVCYKNIHIYSPRNTKEDIDAVINYFENQYPDILIGFSKENRQETKRRQKTTKKMEEL